jgi:hypothetical protein
MRGVWGGNPTAWRKIVVGDSRNHRGATRLYRRDEDTDFSVQTSWTGSRWRLLGYNGDTYHADTHVGYADAAGNSSTTSQTNFSNLTINSNQVLSAGNYNSYSPTLTGGNASGTWGINITGSSGSTSQTNFTSLTLNSSQVLSVGNYATNAPLSSRTLRAWGHYDGVNNVLSEGLNMGTITRSTNGNYTINFSVTLSNLNYGVFASSSVGSMVITGRGTSSMTVTTQNLVGTGTNSILTVGIIDTI